MTDESTSAYGTSLPGASGTFEGTYDPDVLAPFLDGIPDLMPVEIRTGAQPIGFGIAFMTELTIRVDGGQSRTLPVDHVELHPGENRAVIWVRRAREGSGDHHEQDDRG